jgi:hypothetical protein
MQTRFHLAQANVARMRTPLEDPVMEGFPYEGPSLVLWWMPAGELPSVDAAVRKLLVLRGPCPDAFTFRRPFPAAGEAPGDPPEVDAEFCRGGRETSA